MEFHPDQIINYSSKSILLLNDQSFYILSYFLGFHSTFQDFLAPVLSWESYLLKPQIAKRYVLIFSAHYGWKRKAPSKWFLAKGINTHGNLH